MIVGVILAGGGARRMGGGDKTLLMLGGRPLLAHVIERLGSQVDSLALSANGDPCRFAALGIPVITDSVPDAGPLAGVLAGLDWAADAGAQAVASVAGDTPRFPADLVAVLSAAMQAAGAPVAVAATPDAAGGLDRHPTFGLWSVALRQPLRAALAAGARRVGDWAAAQGGVIVAFPDVAAFTNVNTPADLESLRRSWPPA